MKHSLEQAIDGLRRAGLRPGDRQIQEIREAGTDALPALVALAADKALLEGPEPAAFAPLHALRLLAEQPGPDATIVERLLQVLPLLDPDPGAQAWFVWRQDLPQILGRAGPEAFEVAAAILQDAEAHLDRRAAAAETLVYATAVDKSLRPQVAALLREHLTVETDPYLGGYLVDGLADLGAADAYADVMSAYRRGAVDKTIISAADARRRLLSRTMSASLGCALHTLEERYVQHGPFTEEQRQAMVDQHLGRA